MKRDIETVLQVWKDEKDRKPLLIRGARQVGKTYTVREFARQHFTNLVEINFEQRPELKTLFQSLKTSDMIRNIQVVLNAPLEVGKTLLFLDEIQECPQAILALRYFYEECPDLHLIGAGSLLEFALNERDFKMPVGRVQYLYLQPLSFEEFLTALGEDPLRKQLQKISVRKPPSEAIHQLLFQRLKDYMLIGGMPAVVRTYREDKTSRNYQNQQTLLLQTFRDDFGKYASRARQVDLHKVFLTAPGMVGRRYKYSHIDPDTQARDLKEALFLLRQAGVLTKVLSASAGGLPLQTHSNQFKIVFLDVGLMQRGCGLDTSILAADDLVAVNAGAVAEQFVGQELLALIPPYEDRRLFFWARDKRGSQAEIDYLWTCRSRIFPVEVKSGKTGTLRSLKLFLDERKSPVGIRLAQQPLSFHEKILTIPLYAAGQIQRLLDEVIKRFRAR